MAGVFSLQARTGEAFPSPEEAPRKHADLGVRRDVHRTGRLHPTTSLPGRSPARGKARLAAARVESRANTGQRAPIRSPAASRLPAEPPDLAPRCASPGIASASPRPGIGRGRSPSGSSSASQPTRMIDSRRVPLALPARMSACGRSLTASSGWWATEMRPAESRGSRVRVRTDRMCPPHGGVERLRAEHCRIGGTAKAQGPGRRTAVPGSHHWTRISGIPPGAEDHTRAGGLPAATPPDHTARYMLLRPSGARPRRGRTCPVAPDCPLLARPGLSGSAETDRESNWTWAARETCTGGGVPLRPRTPSGEPPNQVIR